MEKGIKGKKIFTLLLIVVLLFFVVVLSSCDNEEIDTGELERIEVAKANFNRLQTNTKNSLINIRNILDEPSSNGTVTILDYSCWKKNTKYEKTTTSYYYTTTKRYLIPTSDAIYIGNGEKTKNIVGKIVGSKFYALADTFSTQEYCDYVELTDDVKKANGILTLNQINDFIAEINSNNYKYALCGNYLYTKDTNSWIEIKKNNKDLKIRELYNQVLSNSVSFYASEDNLYSNSASFVISSSLVNDKKLTVYNYPQNYKSAEDESSIYDSSFASIDLSYDSYYCENGCLYKDETKTNFCGYFEGLKQANSINDTITINSSVEIVERETNDRRWFATDNLSTIVIDSATIANSITSLKAIDNGLHTYDYIYIKDGCDTSNSTYLLEQFTVANQSDKIGYAKWVNKALFKAIYTATQISEGDFADQFNKSIEALYNTLTLYGYNSIFLSKTADNKLEVRVQNVEDIEKLKKLVDAPYLQVKASENGETILNGRDTGDYLYHPRHEEILGDGTVLETFDVYLFFKDTCDAEISELANQKQNDSDKKIYIYLGTELVLTPIIDFNNFIETRKLTVLTGLANSTEALHNEEIIKKSKLDVEFDFDEYV